MLKSKMDPYVVPCPLSTSSDGVLSRLLLRPVLTVDTIGEAALTSGVFSLYGTTPASDCTSNAFYGCERTAGNGNLVNVIQSAKVTTAASFSYFAAVSIWR